MAYIPIGEITLKTDFTARDITIINYNQTLADIKAYLTSLNTNVEYVKDGSNTIQTSVEEPTNADVEYWFEIMV